MPRIEETFEDILQNIETQFIAAYRADPEMTDYNVGRVLESVVEIYKAEKIGRAPRNFTINDLERRTTDAVRHVCEWRLGRVDLDGQPIVPPDPAVVLPTVDEMVVCLKRIQKSVQRWNNQGGRRGYLTFVSQFIR